MVTESEISKAIREYIERSGFFVIRLNSGMVMVGEPGYKRAVRLCPPGTPDILFLFHGKAIFLEVKKSQKEKEKWIRNVDLYKKTAFKSIYIQGAVNQYLMMKTIEQPQNGGDCYLVASVDEVKAIINNLKQ